MADSTDSEPDELKKHQVSASGEMLRSSSASSSIGPLRNEKRYVNESSATCRCTTSTSRGWQWPSDITIAPPQASR